MIALEFEHCSVVAGPEKQFPIGKKAQRVYDFISGVPEFVRQNRPQRCDTRNLNLQWGAA